MGKKPATPLYDHGELLTAYQAARTDGFVEQTWVKKAACRGSNPDVFFPERGAPVKPAKDICGTCPVSFSCLLDALVTPAKEDFGIRGGMALKARQNLRTQLNREVDALEAAKEDIVASEAAEFKTASEITPDDPIPASVLSDMAGFILDSYNPDLFPESLAS